LNINSVIAQNNTLDFDGINDYVSIGSPASLQITGELTYEGWIKTSNVGFVFGRRINDTAAGIASNFEGGSSVQFVINDGSTTSQLVVGSTPVNDGEWHHIAAVYVPGTSLTLYIDGNQEDQLTTSVFASLNAASLPFHIGAKNGSSQFFNGEMDEIRIWNVARTQAEIINNMGNTLTSETGLVASYDFNVGTPSGSNTGLTTLPDVTGSGNDGTLTNFALAGTTSNWVAETGDYNPEYSLISKQPEGTVLTASNHGLTFTDISYLNDDGDEILFASQSTSIEGNFTDDINTNVLDSRWERDWYVDINDINEDGGLATMTFDFDVLGLGTPTGKYALLYRENTSLQYVLTHVNPDIVGNTVSFKGNIGSISDGYYTIGNLTTVNSTVIYVNENAGGSADGTSWSSAFNDLEEALAISGTNVEIWVAKGTYTPSDIDREVSFRIEGTEMNNLSLLGGFVGNELSKDERDPKLNNTILSGDLFYDDNDNIVPEESTRSDNSIHVLYTAGVVGLLIDGFTISGGNANIASGFSDNGGGIINFATIDIKNCSFERNTASDQGGGIWMNSGNSDLINVKVTNNYAFEDGGGLYSGGNPRIFNCWFENNMAQNGGGLYLSAAGSFGIVTNSFFVWNTATNLGGGILATFNSSTQILNNTIYNNSASTEGGGIYVSLNSDSPIKNNIIWDNNATTGDDVRSLGTSDIDYNLISSGASGPNGKSNDPMFTDISNGDFSLVSGSGAINFGDNNSIAQDRPDIDGDANTTEDTPFDFSGDLRVQFGAVDMGALEFGGASGSVPGDPTDLFAQEISDTQIDLTWTDNASDETGFKVERSDDGGASFKEIATLVLDANTYSDIAVSAGNAYRYRIRALNEAGYSGYSNEKFASTFIPPHNALYFDGADNYISITDTDDFSFGDGSTDQPFSVESWVKFDNINSAGILSKRAGQNEWHMATSGSGEFSITLADQSASAFLFSESTGVTINTGQWYHLAFTYDGSSTEAGITLYIDGVEPTTSPSSSGSYVAMENTTSNLEFGTINSGASFNFNGQMDEVRIWSDVRSQSEIQNNMFSLFPGLKRTS